MADSNIKCVIIEDEQHTTRLMEDYVSKVAKLELLGSFVSPIDFMNYERSSEVQLIYLDINLPGMTGLDFLHSIDVNAEVIFTTAYSEYAIQGYELNVTDYLVKPVEFSRFLKATNKAIGLINLKRGNINTRSEGYIMLKVDKKLMKFVISDIIYIQSDWNYIYVHTKEGKFMVLSTMKGIEEMLSKYNFIRIHKSYLINLDYFEFIEGNQVQVGGVKLQVSRNYKNDLLESLNR